MIFTNDLPGVAVYFDDMHCTHGFESHLHRQFICYILWRN